MAEQGLRAAPAQIRLVFAVALVFLGVALILVLTQVEITVANPTSVPTERACGSALDAITDRSGWREWWARDLDEVDPQIRRGLPRTSQCPDAVNRRLVGAVMSVGISAALIAALRRLRARNERSDHPPPDTEWGDLGRLGRQTTLAGAALVLTGVIAIGVLVADSSSTLFLYVDRGIVAIVGLIVLVPALVLVVLGRALQLLGER